MLPWSTDLAGRLDRHVIDSRLLRDNPLGDPHERPLWVYVPPGYDDGDAGTRRSTSSRDTPGTCRCGRTARAFRQPFIETADALFAAGDAPRLHRGLRRRVDRVRRVAVRRLDRHRQVPLLPVRRGRAVGRRPLPHHRRPRVARDQRQVVRRVRRDDHADAAAGPVRRAGHARRRQPLRAVLHPGLRQGGPAACATTTTTSSGGGPTSASRTAFTTRRRRRRSSCCSASPPASRPAPDGTPELPFDPTSGQLRPEVWQRWLDWDPVRMIDRYADALRSLRAIWIDAGNQRRVVPRPRRRPRSATGWPGSACPTSGSCSSSSTPGTAASTTGIRRRWPGSRTGSRADKIAPIPPSKYLLKTPKCP